MLQEATTLSTSRMAQEIQTSKIHDEPHRGESN